MNQPLRRRVRSSIALLRDEARRRRKWRRDQNRVPLGFETLEDRRVLTSSIDLLADIYPGTSASSPGNSIVIGSHCFFAADDGTHGRELWKTDGTPAGTTLVKDIHSIYGGLGASSPQRLTNVNGLLYFVADDGLNGTELWKSDGTASGTVLVRDIYTGPSSSNPQSLTNVNGVLFFVANSPGTGAELWKSDSATGVTALVKDIFAGSTPSSATNLIAVGNTLFFTATDGTGGVELWKSDGTTAGTILVKDIRSGTASSSPSALTLNNGILYFSANDGVSGMELWTSDGTPAGTVLVADIYAGFAGADPANVTSIGGILYFTAKTASFGAEPWRSDGTAGGTMLIKDVRPGGLGSDSAEMTEYNGAIYFRADDGVNGTELWVTDGTAAGTTLLKDIYVGVGSGYPWRFARINGLLAFSATGSATGNEIWVTDGTPAGTQLVKDINSGAANAFPSPLGVLNGKLLFAADDGLNGVELYHSDGTAGGTSLLADVNAIPKGSAPAYFTDVGGTLFFVASDPLHGRELWKYDGSPTGPSLVKDIYPGAASSYAESLTKVGALLYFVATDGTSGYELWRSDGTAAGTTLVMDIAFGGSSSAPEQLVAVDGTLYFTATNTTYGRELWKSNGTSAGTVLVKDIVSGSGSSSPTGLTNGSGWLLFSATTTVNGTELWKSDGTAAGTAIVRDIVSGSAGSSPSGMTSFNGLVYFSADDAVNGSELWKSDGTFDGTQLVANIYPGSTGSYPSKGVVFGNRLYFVPAQSGAGKELWRTDGTAIGTELVKDIQPGVGSSEPAILGEFDGALYFTAISGTIGRELWRTSGTSIGTVLVKDVNPGAGSMLEAGSIAPQFAVVGDQFFFSATDGAHGYELWRSDGTALGTNLVADLATGPSNAYPQFLASWNDKLVFYAFHSTYGAEAFIYSDTGNNAPTDVFLSGATVAENSASGTPVGELSVEDPDIGDSHTLTLVNDAGGRFQIVGHQLQARGAIDFESTPALSIIVRAVDSQGLSLDKAFSVSVTDRNETPTAITLSNDTIAENWLGQVGVISGIDPDAGDGLTFSLINDAGGYFRIAGDQLHVDHSADYESASEYVIVIRGTDSGGLYLDREMMIHITDAPERPGDIRLRGSSVFENSSVGTYVGELSASDPDAGDEVQFSLLDDANGRLYLSGTKMRVAGNIDYESTSTLSIIVRATDRTNLFTDASFVVSVLDLNESPIGAVQLVKDIEPNGGASFSRNFKAIGDVVYFTATTEAQGTEMLWRTDGTLTGTARVQSMASASLASFPRELTDRNGVLSFVTGNTHQTLWTSDGSEDGTIALLNGSVDQYFGHLAVMDDSLYFTVHDPALGSALWKSDGTSLGTSPVVALGGQPMGACVPANGKLVFVVRLENGRSQLWASDGTAAGTGLITEINPTGNADPRDLTLAGNRVYFTADDGIHGRELWKTDGSAAGTELVMDVLPGNGSAYPIEMTVSGGMVYFTADDGAHGRELWKTDGSALGTVLVKDLVPGMAPSGGTELTDVDGIVYFSSYSSTHGWELWKSDGTADGTQMVSDINPGAASSVPSGLVRGGETLFFFANNGAGGKELWATDGTDATTRLVKEIGPGAKDAVPQGATSGIVTLGNQILFNADDRVHGLELWISDGTESNTHMVKDIETTARGSFPWMLTDVDGQLFFNASSEIYASTLFQSDGTTTGTTALISGAIVQPREVIAINGAVCYFTDGSRLWKSDGTSAGTSILFWQFASFSVGGLTNLQGSLVFSATDFGSGMGGLWTTDGTMEGTRPIKTIAPGGNSSPLSHLVTIDDQLYFVTDDGVHGAELWRSDGTADGTELVADIRPGAGGSAPRNLTNIEGQLYFVANDGVHGDELWKSNGTSVGTTMVADLAPGSAGSAPDDLTAIPGWLLFTCNDGSHGRELWVSNGTTGGTSLVLDVLPGNSSGIYEGGGESDRFVSLAGIVYFSASPMYSSSPGQELWRSDGTTVGTYQVKDLRPSSGSFPRNLTVVHDTLYLTASTDVGGRVVWRSNGTSDGTVRVRGMDDDAWADNLTNVRGRLFLTVDDHVHGEELWVSMGDSDGLPDDLESGAPNNGDGNLDGIADSIQENVASLPNAADGRYVTLAGDPDVLFGDVVAATNPSSENTPPGIDFPVGFLEFTVAGIANGAATAVTLLLPPDTVAQSYYKYGPTPDDGTPHWYEFLYDADTGTGAVITGNQVVIHFVDGARGDDDLSENGLVVDPGAPIIFTNQPPTARIAAPGDLAEGGLIQLDAGATTDPDLPNDVLVYEWDYDSDGAYDDASGVNPIFSATGIDGYALIGIGLRVTDAMGEVDFAQTQIAIQNARPTANADTGSVTENGATISINVLANDTDPAGAADPLSITGVNTSGTLGSVGFTASQVTYDPNGQFESLALGETATDTFAYSISDGDGGTATGIVTVTITGENDGPSVSVLNGSVTVPEGTSALNSGGFADMDASDTVTITASIGAITQDAGSSGSWSWSFATTDGPTESQQVTITATDSQGASSSVAFDLVVKNVAPRISGFSSSAVPCSGIIENQTVTVSLVFVDPGMGDTHTTVIDWGDGTTTTVSIAAGVRTIASNHAYAVGGVYGIAVSLTDDDGGLASAMTSATIVGVGIVDRVLYVVGTSGADRVHLNGFSHTNVRVHADFLPKGPRRDYSQTNFDRVVIYLCGGNDTLTTAGNVSVPTYAHGGSGNDDIHFAGGPAIVVGGAGDDRLAGGLGGNILIGGAGADTLRAGNRGDVMVDASTQLDSDVDALFALLGTWNSCATMDDRVNAVVSALEIDESNDGVDQLFGGAGNDLIFADLDDVLRGNKKRYRVVRH